MEKLLKQINDICTSFLRDEGGNRLSPWAWVTFVKTITNTIQDYKVSDKKENGK